MLHDMPDVPHEVLVSILVFLWRSDEYAPRMAAVSRCWARASADAGALSVYRKIQVKSSPPHRA